MTAKEMFEELGYTYFISYNTVQCFKNTWEHMQTYYSIIFDFKTKSVELSKEYGDDYYIFVVDMPTNKAIQKQLEELGWLV